MRIGLQVFRLLTVVLSTMAAIRFFNSGYAVAGVMMIIGGVGVFVILCRLEWKKFYDR